MEIYINDNWGVVINCERASLNLKFSFNYWLKLRKKL